MPYDIQLGGYNILLKRKGKVKGKRNEKMMYYVHAPIHHKEFRHVSKTHTNKKSHHLDCFQIVSIEYHTHKCSVHYNFN